MPLAVYHGRKVVVVTAAQYNLVNLALGVRDVVLDCMDRFLDLLIKSKLFLVKLVLDRNARSQLSIRLFRQTCSFLEVNSLFTSIFALA